MAAVTHKLVLRIFFLFFFLNTLHVENTFATDINISKIISDVLNDAVKRKMVQISKAG